MGAANQKNAPVNSPSPASGIRKEMSEAMPLDLDQVIPWAERIYARRMGRWPTWFLILLVWVLAGIGLTAACSIAFG